MPSLVIPCFRILGSAVGGRCLFSSSFEYANFVEKCCADIGAPGANLLRRLRYCASFSNGIYEAKVYCKRALHNTFFFKPC